MSPPDRCFADCRGCWKYSVNRCATFPECWLRDAAPYKQYAAKRNESPMAQARNAIRKDLWEQGLDPWEMALALNVSVHAIRMWHKKQGLEPHEKKRKKARRANEALKAYRYSLGLLQREMAERYGVAVETWSNYETGATLLPERLKEDLKRWEAETGGLNSPDYLSGKWKKPKRGPEPGTPRAVRGNPGAVPVCQSDGNAGGGSQARKATADQRIPAVAGT